MEDCRHYSADLTALAMGERTGAGDQALRKHLAECAKCRAAFKETQDLFLMAENLPGIESSPAFHEKVSGAVQVEKALTGLSLAERCRLAAGYLAFQLKKSTRTRVLVYATAAQVVVLIALIFTSDLIVQRTPDSDLISMVEVVPETDSFSSETDLDLSELDGLILQERERADHDAGKKRVIEPPSWAPSPPVVAGPVLEWVDPGENLDRMIERENRFELSRYRMYARLNVRCKNHVRFGRGGDDRTDYAVGCGLRWLKAHQSDDGSWDPDGLHGGDPRARVGITALAVAAFLSEGFTRSRGQFAASVGDGLHFILANQDDQGRFGWMEDEPAIALFNQSTSVLALAEHYILSRGDDEEGLTHGIARLIAIIEPDQTGTDQRSSTHGAYADTWAAMALRTAVMTGIEVEGLHSAVAAAVKRVAMLAEKEPWRTVPVAASIRTPPLYSASEEALKALFEEEKTVPQEAIVLFPDRNNPETLFTLLEEPDFREPSFLFFIGTALCEDRDPIWIEWNQRVKTILLENQQQDGLWLSDGDWPWIDGGDVYTTAMHLLTLQVYYRYIKLEENCL